MSTAERAGKSTPELDSCGYAKTAAERAVNAFAAASAGCDTHTHTHARMRTHTHTTCTRRHAQCTYTRASLHEDERHGRRVRGGSCQGVRSAPDRRLLSFSVVSMINSFLSLNNMPSLETQKVALD